MRTATNTSPRGLALRWHSRGRRRLLPRRGRPALLVAVGVLAVGVLAFNLLWAPPSVAQNASAPDRPSRPTATSVSHDSVTISWTGVSNSDITGYQILRRNRDTDARGAWTVIDEDADSLGTTYTDDTVSPSTRYAYRVRARNAHGLSRASRSARIETPAAPEPAPAKHDDGDTYLRGHQDPPWTGHTVNTISRTVSHSINSPGGELWYTLPSLEADRVYHFFPLTNSIGNTKFEIYDSNGNIVRQKGHEVAAQAGTWTDRLGRVINRSLRLYFIPETDGTYHLRVYSTQSKTGTITLRYQDVTFARPRGDSSGEDCNSNIFFVNCRIKAGEDVSGKIHVDDGASSTWNDGMKTITPTPDGDGEYQSVYSEVDAYKTYLRKGFTYKICAATAGDGPLSLYIDRNYVNGKSTTSSGGATLCLNFTPEWTGSFYFKVGSRNQTDRMTGDTTVPSIGTYTISYTSN